MHSYPSSVVGLPSISQPPHFLVNGLVLSRWRLWGNLPACMYVEWPTVSLLSVSPLPLLHVLSTIKQDEAQPQWVPMRLHRAWCLGSWQWVFFSTSWQPKRLRVLLCTGRHPMLRMYLRHLEQTAQEGNVLPEMATSSGLGRGMNVF